MGQHVGIRALDFPLNSDSFVRAWIELKHVFPILGAQVIERDDASGMDFVVDPRRLNFLIPTEVDFLVANSPQDVERHISELMSGPRRLSNDVNTALTVIQRTADEDRFDLFFAMARYVGDEMAKLSVIRNFLQLLSVGAKISRPQLKDRLAMAASFEPCGTALIPSSLGGSGKKPSQISSVNYITRTCKADRLYRARLVLLDALPPASQKRPSFVSRRPNQRKSSLLAGPKS